MHQMALAQGILDIVLDVADDHAARTVRLRVGELHAVTRGCNPASRWAGTCGLTSSKKWSPEMCLVLPSRVVALGNGHVEVELADGQRALVSSELKPDLAIGDFVLVDRGLVIETIGADEAQAILQMYAEIGDMLEAEDALAQGAEHA